MKSASSLFSFMAYPSDPSSIPTSSSQSIGTLSLLLNPFSPTALLASTYRVSVRSFSGSFEQSVNFNPVSTAIPSFAFDGLGNSVIRGYCSNSGNGDFHMDRTSLDSALSTFNPTHTAVFNTEACTGINWLFPLAKGAVDYGSKTFALATGVSGSTSFVVGSLYNCSAASSCTECSILSAYCSWCASSTGPSCVETAQCTSPDLPISTCPVISTTTPATVSAEGTTSITIAGSGFAALESNMATRGGLYCLVVDNSTSNPSGSAQSLSKLTVFSDSLARCNVNPLSSVESSGSTAVSFTFAYSSGTPILQSNLYSLPIYSCSLTSLCSDCASASRPDCRWCQSDSVCLPRLTNATCPTPLSPIVSYYAVTSTCALLQSITPSSIPTHFANEPTAPQTVQIVADFPNATSGWSCVFGSGLATTAGTLDFASKTVTCPIAQLSSIVETNVSVQVKLGTNFFGSNSLFLRYYNCSRLSNCSQCLDDLRPYCSWCLSSASCVGMATAAAQGCSEVTAPPSLPTAPTAAPTPSSNARLATCPTASITPPSILIGSPATTITLSGGPFMSGSTYTCSVAIGTTVDNSTATYINSTAISCTAPALASYTSSYVDAKVTVVLGSLLYLGPKNLRYYSCSNAPNCSTCADPLHTACGWCMTTSACGEADSMTCSGSTVPHGQCPTVTSVSPSAAAYQGGRTMTLTGAFDATGDYLCWFRGPLNATLDTSIELRTEVMTYNTTATRSGSSTITCPSPLIVGPGYGFYEVSVLYRFDSGVEYTAFPTFAQVYMTNCLLMSNCTKCFSALPTECKWCSADASCQHTSAPTCLFGKTISNNPSSCPIITSITPLQAQAHQMTTVTIRGSNLVDNTILPYLRCSMDGFNTLGISSNSSSGATSQLQCPTHPNSQAGTAPFRLLTIAGVSGTFARYTDPATHRPYNFTTYDCLSSLTCDQCLQNANRGICGWCSATHSCTDAASCSSSTTWSNSTCARVTRLSKYGFDQTDVGTALNVTVSEVELAGSMRLGCSFAAPDGSAVYVNATSVSGSTITCPIGASPLAGVVGVVSVQVVNAQLTNSTTAPPHHAFTSNLGDVYNSKR